MGNLGETKLYEGVQKGVKMNNLKQNIQNCRFVNSIIIVVLLNIVFTFDLIPGSIFLLESCLECLFLLCPDVYFSRSQATVFFCRLLIFTPNCLACTTTNTSQ